jgi:hypothetical protein
VNILADCNQPDTNREAHMTKKQARIRNEAYRQALAEGRVVRYNQGCSFRSFKTAEEAEAFIQQIKTFVPEADAQRIFHDSAVLS